jgi:hypothetical protein
MCIYAYTYQNALYYMPRNNFYTITLFQKSCKIHSSTCRVRFILDRNGGKKVTINLYHVLISEDATELTTFGRLLHVDSGELKYTC